MSVDAAAEHAAIRVVIADDHQIFRSGLRLLLENEPGFVVIGEADDGAAALAMARELRPDVLLLDVAMPGLSGLQVLWELSRTVPPCPTLLLTAAIEKADVLQALKLGARGVALKETTTTLLVKAIRAVVAGEYWVARDTVADLVKHLRRTPLADKAVVTKKLRLTRREQQVVATIVAGYQNNEIAQHFSISEETVKHHIHRLFNKLNVSNRLQLALFAIHHDLTGD